MSDPERAERGRPWAGLAVAVATLWVLAVGGEAAVEAATAAEWEALLLCASPTPQAELRRQARAWQARLISVFRRGWVRLLVTLWSEQALPEGAFWPEPWPTLPDEEGGQNASH